MDSHALILTFSEFLGVTAVLMLAGLSAQLKVAPVGFKYPRREGLAALVLFAVILAVKILFLAGTLGAPAAEAIRSGALTTRLALAGVALLICLLALRVRRQPLRSTGWYPKAFPGGIRVGIILALLAVILHGKGMTILNGISPQEARDLLVWIGIALGEETVFRGYIQLRLTWWLGTGKGLLLTALLSLIWDLPAVIASGIHPLLAILIGAVRFILLGWAASRSRHTMAPFLYRVVSEWLFFVQ